MSSDVVRWTRNNEISKNATNTTAPAPPPSMAHSVTLEIITTTTTRKRRKVITKKKYSKEFYKKCRNFCDNFLNSYGVRAFKVNQEFSGGDYCKDCSFIDNNNKINVNTSTKDTFMTFKAYNRLRSLLNIFMSILFVISQFSLIFSNLVVIVSASSTNNAASNEFFHSEANEGHYTSTWAVHIPNGDNGIADEVARQHGFINLGNIFDDHYHFHHESVTKRSVSPSHHHQKRLDEDDRVKWAKQQRSKSRKKRDFIRMRPSRTSQTMTLVSSVRLDDPKWPEMWYLNRGNDLDMNVVPAWKEGITGKGIVVTILDDGLETDHPDLEHNYDPKASYDVNSHDEDPMPRYDITDSNRHGTRCAGEVAATANNSLCAVGIAFGACVGGVRMLDGDVTDAVEARSLSLNPQHIDIYSASWGPDDDGKTVDGPGELASRAFIEGVNKGRNGKGSIFIWASGNGGREQDNCNCDGYTNSIWTLSISSATEGGHVPWYSEKCSSTLATTYSSGSQNEKQVVTTDLHHSCTSSHTGTSASAPLAAGIAALVLEANRNLTWRDLQHIVVRTAKPGNLKDPTWSKNGVGRRVSHSFGYGLMDAAEMVRVARTWKTVPEQQRCEINAPHVDKTIPSKKSISLKLIVKHCIGVNFLEHVQAKITLTSQRRGDIQIYLKSPAGTKVTLLTSRTHDVSRSGFSQWPFMSVHTWGESPHGNWELEIHNEGRHNGHALLREWSLIFYGTATHIDPNDPISTHPTLSPNTLFTSVSLNHRQQTYSSQYPKISSANSKSYSVIVLNKANSKSSSAISNGNNRKQQQQQQQQIQHQQQQQQYHQISSYGVILSPSKKNGKNSKNNSNKNNGGGKNSSIGNQKSSTNRPNISQSTLSNQYTSAGSNIRNNLYRISTPPNKLLPIVGGGGGGGGKQQLNVSTIRPKVSQQSLNYNVNFGGGNKLDKPLRIHEKIPIKAPKQIKDIVDFSGSSSSSSNGNNGKFSISTIVPQMSGFSSQNQRYDENYKRVSSSSHNQRIPKLFQQYEKIQQIFPEFHPYVERPKEAISLPSSSSKTMPSRKQFEFNQALDSSKNRLLINNSNNTRPGAVNSNSSNSSNGSNSKIMFDNVSISAASQKPSRENSKKLLSQNFQSERDDERFYIPNRKSAKAQITQWDLIFYGTETPSQPDDPILISPGRFGAYGSDLENNYLNFDSQTASKQWRNMQQIGESHVDEHTESNDQTSSACIKYTPDQRCIDATHPKFTTTTCNNSRILWEFGRVSSKFNLDCHPTTFIYGGRCYNFCPEKSYMIPEISGPELNDDDNQLLEDNEIPIINIRSANDPMNSSSFKEDSIRRWPREISSSIVKLQKQCASCDISCLKCRGPKQSDCLACHSGYQLRIISALESYCYVLSLRSSGNNSNQINDSDYGGSDESSSDFRNDIYMFFIIILPAISLIMILVAITLFKKEISKTYDGNDKEYSYVKVAFDIVDEESQVLLKNEQIEQGALKEDEDDEEFPSGLAS